MLDKILSFFKPTPPPKELVKFTTLGKEEIQRDHPDAFRDLHEGRSHGFLIKNFISQEEVNTILSNFHKVVSSNKAEVIEGFTWPPVFAEAYAKISQLPKEEQPKAIDDYFAQNVTFRNTFVEDFGIDLPTKFDTFFKSIAGNRPVSSPTGHGDKGSYPFGNFRLFKPVDGVVSVHCGNYFQSEFRDFYQQLSSKVMVEDQLSYFIMLNPAEQGGELSIFNLIWEEGQTKASAREDQFVILPNGKKLEVDKDPSMQKMKLSPEPGDMILFQGGNIWHRVERVFGKENRITFGGFIGFSYDNKEVSYWS